MKKIKIGTILLSILIFTIGYSKTSFEIVKETPASPKLSGYKSIYLGWLDLKEADYNLYGHKPGDWKTEIRRHNTEGLQVYLKDALPGKIISGAASPADRYAGNADLQILLKVNDKIKYEKGFVINCSLNVDVMIFDGKTNNLLYTANIISYCTFPFSHLNWKANSFDGALDNEILNLSKAIASKFKP